MLCVTFVSFGRLQQGSCAPKWDFYCGGDEKEFVVTVRHLADCVCGSERILTHAVTTTWQFKLKQRQKKFSLELFGTETFHMFRWINASGTVRACAVLFVPVC